MMEDEKGIKLFHLPSLKNPQCRVRQFLTRFDQVGALSPSLRFQRLLGEGIKTVPGRRPASRRGKSELPL